MHINIQYVHPSYRKSVKDALNTDYEIQRVLGYSKYSHAVIVPKSGDLNAGVVNSLGEPLQDTIEGVYHGILQSSPLHLIKKAIFIGCLHNIWGHCLTDNLKRLWILSSPDIKSLVKDGYIFVYVTIDGKLLNVNARKLLEISGIDLSRLIQIQYPTDVETLIIPDKAFIIDRSVKTELGGRFFTKEFRDTVNHIRLKIPNSKSFPKVYFSRQGLKCRWREFGEKSVEKIFKKAGYKVIRPEDYSLEEQLSIIANCEYFAATDGSICHNSIFCKPGTKLIVLRKAPYINSYQVAINQIANLDVTIIDANHSVPPYFEGKLWEGPFYLCLTKELCNYFNINWYLPYFCRPSYWWYQIRKNNFIEKNIANRKIVHYFENKFL